MTIICPSCGRIVPPESLNINTDLGKCPACKEVFEISKAVANGKLPIVPFGSGITIDTAQEGVIKIKLPVKKFGKSDYMQVAAFVLVLAVWLFIIIETIKTGAVPGIFITLMIFVIPTIKNAFEFLNSLDEDQEIIIEADKITFYKNKPVKSKEYAFELRNISEIKTVGYIQRNPFKKRVYIRPAEIFSFNWPIIPRIESMGRSVWFFEYAAVTEKEWIVKFLNVVLNEYKKNKQLRTVNT